MRIDRTSRGQASPTGLRRRLGSHFALPTEDPDPGHGAVATAAEPEGVAIAAILSERPRTAPPADHQAATQYGRAVLDALAGLQAAALAGEGAGQRDRLTELLRGLPRAAEPGLDDVLRAIAQRAAVELARSE